MRPSVGRVGCSCYAYLSVVVVYYFISICGGMAPAIKTPTPPAASRRIPTRHHTGQNHIGGNPGPVHTRTHTTRIRTIPTGVYATSSRPPSMRRMASSCVQCTPRLWAWCTVGLCRRCATTNAQQSTVHTPAPSTMVTAALTMFYDTLLGAYGSCAGHAHARPS